MRTFSIVSVLFHQFRHRMPLRLALAPRADPPGARDVDLLHHRHGREPGERTLAEGDFGFLDNILNTADFFLVSVVALAILRYGDRSTRFTRFDFGCLAAVALVLVAWGLSRQHVAAHLAIQTILVIAYIPVVRRLWHAERNTESYVMWLGLMIAPLFGLLSSKGTLAAVYAIRSSVCPALLLLLMLRTTLRTSRRKAAGPTIPEAGDS